MEGLGLKVKDGVSIFKVPNLWGLVLSTFSFQVGEPVGNKVSGRSKLGETVQHCDMHPILDPKL